MPNTPWQNSEKSHNYKNIILFKKSKTRGLVNLLKILYKNRNEIIVIGGYSMLAEIVSIFFLKLIRVKFVLNSDGGFITKGFFKTKIKQKLIKSATYWLSSGINTSKSLIYYGANNSNIYEYHFSSLFDNEILKEQLPLSIKEDLRAELSLKNGVVYLIFVGQLIHRKGVDILIEALKNVKNTNYEILIIGDGNLNINLKDSIKNHPIKEIVHFLGKLPKEQVLKYLKVSDIFVFPSREDIWGLVLNEAIAYGLPIISTKQVGSSYSLIEPGKNGYIINADDVDELAKAIDSLLARDLAIMKEFSINLAQQFTIENMVKNHLILFAKLKSGK